MNINTTKKSPAMGGILIGLNTVLLIMSTKDLIKGTGDFWDILTLGWSTLCILIGLYHVGGRK